MDAAPDPSWLKGIEGTADLEAELRRVDADARRGPGGVEQVTADTNPFSSYDPDGGVCHRACELGRDIVDAQNRMTTEVGSEFTRAAYESFCLGLEYKLLSRFARETTHALQDLTAGDAISKAVIVLQAEIERPGGDAQEKQEQLAALKQIEELFRTEYADPTTGALPDPSSD